MGVRGLWTLLLLVPAAFLAGAAALQTNDSLTVCDEDCQAAQQDAVLQLVAQLSGQTVAQAATGLAAAPTPAPDGLPAHCFLPGVLCCASTGALVGCLRVAVLLLQQACSEHTLTCEGGVQFPPLPFGLNNSSCAPAHGVLVLQFSNRSLTGTLPNNATLWGALDTLRTLVLTGACMACPTLWPS